EGDVARASGRHRTDRRTLADAEHADARGVDRVARLQQGNSSEQIRRQLLVGGGRIVAGRATDAAVIDAQDRDAMASQVIGDHEEGLVTGERGVSILRPTAALEDDRRMTALAPRDGERAGALDPILGVRVGDLALLVREGRPGYLRPLA